MAWNSTFQGCAGAMEPPDSPDFTAPACHVDSSAALSVSADSLVTLRNGIAAGGVTTDGPTPDALVLEWSLVAGAAELDAVSIGDGVLGGDPGFVDAAAGDYRLAVGSRAIDAGAEADLCDAEPPPAAGLCRADLGYTGNTPLGLSR